MRYLYIGILYCFILSSCKQTATDINEAENPEVSDFIASFREIQLPVQFNNRDLKKLSSDSFFIKSAVIRKFIPDSLFKSEFKALDKIKFFRNGRIKAEETKETYLFLVAEQKTRSWAYVICFDENLDYKTGMLLTSNEVADNTSEDASLDKRLTIIKTRSRNSKDGKNIYNKSAYVYNTEGVFTLILTESNEAVDQETVYNPIDTLAAKDPLSGDYKKDKSNFVSIRDGGKPGKLNFFIHIEKPNGNCEGSLRGDITMVKPKTYHFSKADDHCMLEFTFSGKNNLQVRELEACGNHRGVRCSFDGRYKK
jgi:hypothetical protein